MTAETNPTDESSPVAQASESSDLHRTVLAFFLANPLKSLVQDQR